jgi:hypothetical protein
MGDAHLIASSGLLPCTPASAGNPGRGLLCSRLTRQAWLLVGANASIHMCRRWASLDPLVLGPATGSSPSRRTYPPGSGCAACPEARWWRVLESSARPFCLRRAGTDGHIPKPAPFSRFFSPRERPPVVNNCLTIVVHNTHAPTLWPGVIGALASNCSAPM